MCAVILSYKSITKEFENLKMKQFENKKTVDLKD